MDVLGHIRELLNEYGWSVYRLSMESGVPQSTLANMFSRNNLPSIPTLELICKSLGITLSKFFKDIENDSPKSPEFLEKYRRLNDVQKKLITDVMDNMK